MAARLGDTAALARMLNAEEQRFAIRRELAAAYFAPTGPLMNCCRRPRCGPGVGHTQQPSLLPLGCAPSVTIHRLPALSKPTLSGEPIGLRSAALA